jgi:hypothetical protein
MKTILKSFTITCLSLFFICGAHCAKFDIKKAIAFVKNEENMENNPEKYLKSLKEIKKIIEDSLLNLYQLNTQFNVDAVSINGPIPQSLTNNIKQNSYAIEIANKKLEKIKKKKKLKKQKKF